MKKVVTTKLRVTPKTDMGYLMIRLPANATHIVGVETGVRVVTPVPGLPMPEDFISTFAVKPMRAFGTLRLQQPGCTGLFYATHVCPYDGTRPLADFSVTPDFAAEDITRSAARQVDEIFVPRQAKVLNGIYQNLSTRSYDLMVHVWYIIPEA